MNGFEALKLFCRLPIDGKVLDIGAGYGNHTKIMRDFGLDVDTLDLCGEQDIVSGWPCDVPEPYSGIWCCHTLEHSRNPGAFLDGIKKALKPDGWLAITVPPMKNEIVSGHVTLWNAGLLLYHLILAGFDCSQAKVRTVDYDVSVVVKNKDFVLPELTHNHGDIERLREYFPMEACQGFHGVIEHLNWRS